MENIQKNRMLWRIPLVTAILFALFWGIWYLTGSSVPIISELKIDSKTTIQLPFSMSRWWDVLIAPTWAVFLILLFTNNRIRKDEDLAASLAFGLGVGLVFGLAFFLVGCLIIGLAAFLVTGFGFGLDAGLGAGLVAGLGTGLGAGLAFGLGASLAVGLVICLEFLFPKRIRVKTNHWLIGK